LEVSGAGANTVGDGKVLALPRIELTSPGYQALPGEVKI
jgi:hypothetical protein